MEKKIIEKVDRLKKDLHKSKKRVLFDSNHCFIKGFAWEIVKHIPHEEIGVLILRRDPLDNAKALLRIHDERANRPFTFRLPETLSPVEQNEFRIKVAKQLISELGMRKLEPEYPSFARIPTILPPVQRKMHESDILDKLSATYGIEIMYTNMEWALVCEILTQLKPGWMRYTDLIVFMQPRASAAIGMNPYYQDMDSIKVTIPTLLLVLMLSYVFMHRKLFLVGLTCFILLLAYVLA